MNADTEGDEEKKDNDIIDGTEAFQFIGGCKLFLVFAIQTYDRLHKNQPILDAVAPLPAPTTTTEDETAAALADKENAAVEMLPHEVGVELEVELHRTDSDDSDDDDDHDHDNGGGGDHVDGGDLGGNKLVMCKTANVDDDDDDDDDDTVLCFAIFLLLILTFFVLGMAYVYPNQFGYHGKRTKKPQIRTLDAAPVHELILRIKKEDVKKLMQEV